MLTVGELTRSIKQLLEARFPDIWLKGEVSNCRRAASGHLYFTLKDDTAVMRAVLFRRHQSGIKFALEDGLGLIVHGSVSLFDKRGEYQIIVDYAEPEGRGGLQLAFEQLKEKLRARGLFDEARKKPIPPYPDAVGVVTSETGAALRDILNVISRRYSGIRVIVYPTLVQGDGAADRIVCAVRTANRRKETDVLIVGRGGGSIEDLWPFNEEKVAMAIAGSDIPVISAVGHEVDFTIADFVADLRAPTPSAAAELVVKNKDELVRTHREFTKRLLRGIQRLMVARNDKLSRYTFEILSARINSLVRERTMLMDECHRNLISVFEKRLLEQKSRFEKSVGRLDVLSPLGTLARGYSITCTWSDNRPLATVRQVREGDGLRSRLHDGTIQSTVQSVHVHKAPDGALAEE